MTLQITPTLSFSTRARSDLASITAELADLQRQAASGVRANDLASYGESATRLLQAKSAVALAEGRAELGREVQARLDLQAGALSQASQAVATLVQSVRTAAINDDAAYLGEDLKIAFNTLVSAMNESAGGQPLFAGERVSGRPVKVGTLEELAATTDRADVFDVAERRQRIDLGGGLAFDIGDRASDISWTALEAMRDLKVMIDDAGGALPSGISSEQRNALFALAARLDAGGGELREAEGRTGIVYNRIEDALSQMEGRTNLIKAEVARQSEADLAEVALRLAGLQTQYQATAQTFAQLSRLTLLDFL